MAVKSHIEVAATQGMKAGFNAYMSQLSRSGLPQVQAKLAELQGMRKRQRFATYCAMVGPDVTAFQAELGAAKRTPNATVVPSTKITLPAAPVALSDEIAQARARLAELEALAAAEAKAEKPRTRSSRTSKPAAEVKENLWREWAVRKHGIPQTVGATFAYKGKRRTSTFKVTRITAEGTFTVRVS